MSEETDSAATVGCVLAELSPVTSRVEPGFEDAVSEGAGIRFVAIAEAKVGAWGGGVVEFAGVSPASLLAGMGVGTVGPVMRPAACTLADLKLEHAEVIGGESKFLGECVQVGEGGIIGKNRVEEDGGINGERVVADIGVEFDWEWGGWCFQ